MNPSDVAMGEAKDIMSLYFAGDHLKTVRRIASALDAARKPVPAGHVRLTDGRDQKACQHCGLWLEAQQNVCPYCMIIHDARKETP